MDEQPNPEPVIGHGLDGSSVTVWRDPLTHKRVRIWHDPVTNEPQAPGRRALRAYHLAMAALIAEHRDEYDRILDEERAARGLAPLKRRQP